MITLRCTRKLLERLGVPHDAESGPPTGSSFGDWYANLVRFGRDQFVVVVNERTTLTLLLPAKGARHTLVPDILRTLASLLEDIGVPREAIDRELAAMQPMAYARTASRSLVAVMNERARLAEHLRNDGLAPGEVMASLMRFLVPAGFSEPGDDPRRLARRLLGLAPLPPPASTVAHLHVSLMDIAPAVWRRLVVAEDVPLPDLHGVLQVVMGWENRHLHEFQFGDARYGEPDEDGLDPGLRDERGVRLGEALREAGVHRFRYLYDYGDDWAHDVMVESIGPNVDAIRGAVCVGGANRCPPEDVGGVPGYFDFLQHLRDVAHSEHANALAWAGGEFDSHDFDIELVNTVLRAEYGD